jgi:hypothetical protein
MNIFENSPFISLLHERIDAVAPGIEILYLDLEGETVEGEVSFSADRSVIFIGLAHIARFTISLDLKQAIIRLAPNQEKSLRVNIATYSALLTMLHAVRGRLTFHGNCLSFDGKSYALLGGSGAGKSTLTLFALMHSHRLVGDDSVVILENRDVTGGRPFLHLTKETFSELLPNRTVPVQAKEFQLLANLGLSPALPLANRLSGIYLLEQGDRVEVAPCTDLPRIVFSLLNSGRMMATLVKHDPTIVDRLQSLAETVGVSRLIYPRSFINLPETLQALERDLKRRS